MDEDRVRGVGNQVPGSTKQAEGAITRETGAKNEESVKGLVAEKVNVVGGSEDEAASSAMRTVRDKPANDQPTDKLVLPLHAEALAVSRRTVETGRVQVSTVTKTRDALIDESLARERVEIERKPVGRVVETAPPVREEGDTTIIPVIEETIVVEKRLVLKEEIHVRRVRTMEQHRETVVLREQDAVIRRDEAGAVPGE